MIDSINEKIKENQQSLKNKNKIIDNLENLVFPDFFSHKEIKPYVYLNKNTYSVKVNYAVNFEDSCSTHSIDFTFYVVDDKIDMVSHVSYFTNNSNRKNDTLSEYVDILSKSNAILNSYDRSVLIENITLLKTTLKEIEKLIAIKNQLTTDLEVAKLKSEIIRIRSILIPLNEFCVDSLLCNSFNVPFENNKPNKSDLLLLKTKIKEQDLLNSKQHRSPPLFEKYFFIFDINGSSYKAGEVKFNIHYDQKKNKIEYLIGYQKKSKKAINAHLSNQITFENKLINKQLDLRNKFFDVSSYGDVLELSKNMAVYSAKATIKSF